MSKCDPMWVYENCNSAAERIDDLEALVTRLREELSKLREGQEPVAWMWEMHGWLVTAHGKHRSVKRHVDISRPPESTVNSDDFIRLVPLYASPVTKVVVMPERISKPATRTEEAFGYRNGWNDCLEEIARLNGGQKG